MSAFTPGPWRIIGEDDLPKHDDLMIVAFQVGAGNEHPEPDFFVCNIGSDGGTYGNCAPVEAGEKWPTSLANARLVAAAPDLYEVVRRAIGYHNQAGGPPTIEDELELFRLARAALAKAEGRPVPLQSGPQENP